MTTYIPEAGDFVWLNFEPQAGREMKKQRPALTLSPRGYNQKTSLGIFVPITSKIKGYPFEVATCSDAVHGVILADHVKSLDWEQRAARFIAPCSESVMREVRTKLSLLIMG